MEVILLEKIAKLGKLGDKVTVKNGYGRNFLIPFGKALPATEANLATFEARRTELESAANEQLSNAQKRAAEMAEIELTLTAKAGDEGKLFGSIGPRDLAEAITSAGVAVAKSEIRLPEGPIRAVGEYDVGIQLHSDVAATIKVFIEAE
ncbi:MULTISPECIES: 50S ribosomal protein L9 [Gammaproteobacteria]|uniref:50S ribosomal protein L9 n=1 Tax=Gammaproteobacteria TaxID=1236 RepID=UPI001ADC4782|nr:MULTISPECIES: 50S ribosomal protein L9 [Gammaproteobacteria]MBO9483380.1 50S ribosomal protein L9 [Salinisphaera sp. G21_0]MBO9496217.1 50S ribosomal protein L9 [Thalassotalea sp. G20_0]